MYKSTAEHRNTANMKQQNTHTRAQRQRERGERERGEREIEGGREKRREREREQIKTYPKLCFHEQQKEVTGI